ncbi:phytanoyl-CoA dioxygenase family protein [uncultured Sphingomonas sp.]|uniref:phytanoyl-CoA dioxygenase family protein n=1 Tax=uncultured Sphingomonas sp. TaxID=158754 RepID=UPI0026195717|nr:phytanoyl-CoA dioxygenase family protein [uncultured Sphingomonas sp.]
MANKLQRVLARLPTYWTYMRERPSWVLVLLGGRVLFVRQVERQLRRAAPRSVPPTLSSRLHVDAPDRIVPELERDGVSPRLTLSASDVAAIRAFAEQTPCTTRAAPIRSFLAGDIDAVNAERPRDVIAAYFFDRIHECPTIAKIEADPLIRAIAEGYIGGTPHHIRTRLWWSFPGKRVAEADLHAAAQDKYHFDLNDFRTVKFFFYLTDVDRMSGPHAYIAGSHHKRKIRHQYTLMVGHDEAELRAYYGDDRFHVLTGPAGTGFAEDPFIFHVGMTCKERPRLLLEIEFGPAIASKSYRYGEIG